MQHSDRSITPGFFIPTLLVLLLSGLLIGSVRAAEPDHLETLGIVRFKQDVKAPDFTLKTPEGKQLRLSDFNGKVVLLNFWATW